MIQTLPPALLELPLSLLGRLLLCDPARSVPHLGESARGLFAGFRTAGRLLQELLQPEELWDSAVELLTVLAQVARCSPPPAGPQLHLEPSVLHQALAHCHDPIRAGVCRLLGNLGSFRSAGQDALKPDIFRSLTGCLHDSCMSVRRAACRAVGNWLGQVAWFKMASDAEQQQCWYSEAGEGVTLAAGEEEGRRWAEEARRTATKLPALITDPDALTRRHCCAALGNLVNIEGAVAPLLKEDVASSLLRAACSDTHDAVRQAAVASLCQCSRRDALRQVMR